MKFKNWIINKFPNLTLLFVLITYIVLFMNLKYGAMLLSLAFFVFSIFYFVYSYPFQSKKKIIMALVHLSFSAFFAVVVLLFKYADPEGLISIIWLLVSAFYILINIIVLTKKILNKNKNIDNIDNNDYSHTESNNKIEYHYEIKPPVYVLFRLLDNIFIIAIFIFMIYLIIDDLGSSGMGSGWVAIGLIFWGIIAFIIWFFLNLWLIKFKNNKKAFINLSILMIVLQLAVFIPVVYHSYVDITESIRDTRDQNIYNEAQIYEDCEGINYYSKKEKCANNIFDDTNDIVGCVQLMAASEKYIRRGELIDTFECDGVEYNSSWLYRLDEVEEHHDKIKQEQLEEEIAFAEQDIFLDSRNDLFVNRSKELGCVGYHHVSVDNKSRGYVRPCNNSCLYNLQLNIDKQVSEPEQLANSYKEDSCLAKKDSVQEQIDEYNQKQLLKVDLYGTKETIKELEDFFYSYKLDECIYSVNFYKVSNSEQFENGILDFDNLDATYSHYAVYEYGQMCYISNLDRVPSEYQKYINKYKD